MSRKPAMKLVESHRNTRTPEEWAQTIREKWQDNIQSIFAVALDLETAKGELRDDFVRMYRDELKWSRSMVSRMLAIAEDGKLRDVSHAKLPASWDTLYQLTTLTEEEFERGVESGVIHSGMERKDIAALKPPKGPKEKAKAEPSLHGQELLERRTLEARRVIVSALREMTDGERSEFIALIRLQLDDLDAKAGVPQ